MCSSYGTVKNLKISRDVVETNSPVSRRLSGMGNTALIVTQGKSLDLKWICESRSIVREK